MQEARGLGCCDQHRDCPFSSDHGKLRRDSRKGKVGHLVQTGGLTLGLQISLLDLKVTEGSQHLGGQSWQART